MEGEGAGSRGRRRKGMEGGGWKMGRQQRVGGREGRKEEGRRKGRDVPLPPLHRRGIAY